MARVTGLEPATSGVTGRRSNQLSYTPESAIRSEPRGNQENRRIRQHAWQVKDNAASV